MSCPPGSALAPRSCLANVLLPKTETFSLLSPTPPLPEPGELVAPGRADPSRFASARSLLRILTAVLPM